jgi:hypothetical protein
MERYSFEKAAIAINNRLHDEVGKREQLRIFRQVHDAGPISRTYKHRATKYYCSECGCEVQWIGQKECPQCHARWKAAPVEDHRGWERGYHMELEAKGDIQVCRIYRVERHTWFGKPVGRDVWEVERIMYAPTGERRVFSRSVQGISMYYDAFSRWSSISIKREYKNMGYRAINRYNLDLASFHIKSLTEQWQYKDIPAILNNHKLDSGVLKIIAYPWAETVLKTGQIILFKYCVKYLRVLNADEVKALNICNRNHYMLKDPGIWLDHIELLKHFDLDIHNAHYVCPKDLHQAHNELTARRRIEWERIRAEEKLKHIGKEREAYVKRWANVLPLTLSGQDLAIRPLQSVDEFADEAKAMHHCVFANEYYKRANCLILSAKDSEGNRLATIEYDTASNKIVQCRAACNQVPKRDAEIRQLITSHRSDFERMLRAA